MKKRIAAIAAITLGTCIIGVAPAMAGSVSYGSLSCNQGSIFSKATGNQTVRHEHRRNGTYYRKDFANGSVLRTNTYYPGIASEDAASIQNGTGTLTGASRNCAD